MGPRGGKPLWKLLGGLDAGAARRARRLPLPRRRAHARRGARACCAAPSRAAPSASASSLARRLSRPTRRPRAGSAIRTRSARRSCREAVADGFTHFKLKVGADLDDDLRRARIVREEIGPRPQLMIDANQVWGVERGDRRDAARSRRSTRGGSRSRRAPTTCSATPRSARRSRRSASRPASTCRTASCSSSSCRPGDRRLPARLLPARRRQRGARRAAARGEVRRAGLPARGRRRAVRVRAARRRSSTTSRSAASLEDRVIEFVDHLHEHFVDPVVVRARALPRADGAGLQHRDEPESLAEFAFPDGPVWAHDARGSAR